jgi:CPA2 family monovalent cation:H+ antiporter-2
MDEGLPIIVIYEVGILVLAASLSSEFFKRIRLPGLIGPILVGLIIGGPGGLGLVTSLAIVEILGILGSVLILFMVGLEFEATAFWGAGKTAFLVTTGGVTVSLILGYLIGYALGWPPILAFLLGVVIAPSGTSVVASTLELEGQVESKIGETLLTACVVDDVEAILLLNIALAMLSERTMLILDGMRVVILAVLFILAPLYVGGRLLPLIISRFERIFSDEVLFTIFLGAGLVFAFAATQIGLAAITGAFLMGAMIPYAKVGEKISHHLFFMKEVFAAIFFVSIGLSINPFDIIRLFPIALIVCATGVVARLLGGFLAGMATRFDKKQLATMIIGLAIRAETSLIIAREAAATGLVGTDFLPIATAMVVLSLVLITPIYSRMIRNL